MSARPAISKWNLAGVTESAPTEKWSRVGGDPKRDARKQDSGTSAKPTEAIEQRPGRKGRKAQSSHHETIRGEGGGQQKRDETESHMNSPDTMGPEKKTAMDHAKEAKQLTESQEEMKMPAGPDTEETAPQSEGLNCPIPRHVVKRPCPEQA